MNPDRLLTMRVVVPVALTFLLIDHFGNAFTGALMFLFTQVNVALPALYLARNPHLKVPGRLMVAAEIVLIGTGVSLLLSNDHTVGGFGRICSITSQLMFGAAAMWLIATKRPNAHRDGLLDAGAALIGVSAITWHLQIASKGTEMHDAAKTGLLIFCAFIMLSVFAALARLISRSNYAKRPLIAIVAASLLLAVSIPLTGGYSNAHPATGVFAAGNLAGFLLGAALLHSRIAEYCQPDLSTPTKIGLLSWLGPASALVVTPVMFLILFTRSEAPSLPMAAAAALLTVVVLWRISRLMRQREASRHDLSISEQRFRSLVEHSADVIAVINADGCLTSVSGGFEQMTGRPAEALLGASVHALLAPGHSATFDAGFIRARRAGEPIPLAKDIALLRSDGDLAWTSVLITNHVGKAAINGWVLNLHDVTERKTAEDALFNLALHDQLTGSPNRVRILQLLGESIAANPGRTVLVFCDLNGFKEINDTLGHEAGDEVLKSVSRRWTAVLRRGDALGRWGGDEFIMLCPGLSSERDARAVTKRLTSALEQPIAVGDTQVRVGTSVGWVVHEVGETPESFIHRADEAMYEVKRRRESINGSLHSADC